MLDKSLSIRTMLASPSRSIGWKFAGSWQTALSPKDQRGRQASKRGPLGVRGSSAAERGTPRSRLPRFPRRNRDQTSPTAPAAILLKRIETLAATDADRHSCLQPHTHDVTSITWRQIPRAPAVARHAGLTHSRLTSTLPSISRHRM